MTIDKIRENLQNTIKGKELYLESIRKSIRTKSRVDAAMLGCAAEALRINLDELKKILKDVEECCEP